jgi:aromatic-L-amino-acid decarboxylase
VLDPADWERFRASAHHALDDAIDFMRDVRERPVWQPVPEDVKETLRAPMPRDPTAFDDVYDEFKRAVLPYATGNIHPRFLGWVHGSGTPGGAVADMLAAAMNSNAGGRDHGAVYVERQVISWFHDLFGWSAEASGLLVVGTSAANLGAVLVARTSALQSVREHGVEAAQSRLTGYASAATHSCVKKALEIAGLGSTSLRVLPVDAEHRIDVNALHDAVHRDRARGYHPFLIVGNAGTVDVGAIDPLEELAEFAADERLWFHVDGAFGAPAYLSPALRTKLAGIERADSIAFDFHKWLHVPYDAGCLIIRDGAMHRATFAGEGPYITRMQRGLAAGEPWFADFGPDLSRSFRALKVWFTIKEHGAVKLGEAIQTNCAQAAYLREKLAATGRFEVYPGGELQIVCFWPRASSEATVDEAVIRLQESGTAVISSTTLDGRRVMRACITNHRTRNTDLDLLVASIARIVEELQSTRSV